MGKDQQPKHRQAARTLQRRKAVRQPYERMLIVCEGEKTEPNYLRAIQREHRLSSTHVQVLHGQKGTDPAQVLAYAHKLFLQGDATKGLQPRAFDRLVVVFDRDEHHGYHAALADAQKLSGKIKSDEGVAVPVDAVASVPCFELWLLLHFEDVTAPLTAAEALARLTKHAPQYAKGNTDHWAETRAHLPAAIARAKALAAVTTAHDGHLPYTDMHSLVERLVHLKDGGAEDDL
jgi:hypothetical protein